MNLQHLESALRKAMHPDVPEDSSLGAGPRNRKRSCAWVEALADELRLVYRPEDNFFVFSKECKDHRKPFGINELLYDVTVVETALCASHSGSKQLRFVTRAVWLIESEFARDSAAAVKDFNKLVLGASDNKLFVGPRLSNDSDDTRFRDALIPVARKCVNAESHNVFLAQASHPNSWTEDAEPTVALWKLNDARWERV